MIYLHKILPWIFLPIGVTLTLLIAGVLLRRKALVVAGCVVLWVASMPLISRLAARAVEEGAERHTAADAPQADAIVVLSEGRIVAPGSAGVSEWNDADRFFGGMELLQSKRAPLLVFTGGWQPWEPNAPLEGEVLARYAKALGAADEQVVRTGRVTTTEEEAHAVASLLDGRDERRGQKSQHRSILLVTSAYHMARAKELFLRAGFDVIPFPVDFQVSAGRSTSIIDLLPTAGGMLQTEGALREVYGRAFYAIAR